MLSGLGVGAQFLVHLLEFTALFRVVLGRIHVVFLHDDPKIIGSLFLLGVVAKATIHLQQVDELPIEVVATVVLIGNLLRVVAGATCYTLHAFFVFKVVGEDAGGTFDLGGTGARFVVLCRALRSNITTWGLLISP